MKMFSFRRVLSVFTAALIFATSCGLTATASKDSKTSSPKMGKKLSGKDFQVVATVDNLTLSCNPSTGNFSVEDTTAGKTYYANPVDITGDELAKGLYRSNMQSQLILTIANKEDKIDPSCSSYAYCIIENGLSVYEIENGARFVYDFEDLSIIIPMDVTLEKGRLSVEIDYDSVEEKGDNKLLEIAVLPFFGCASPEDNGYFLLPDGSGALVDFHGKKAAYGQYVKDVYGADEYSESQFVVRNGEVISLPIIGACFKNAEKTCGYLTLVEEGAGNAKLILDPYQWKSNYENAYFNFMYRDHQKATALDRTYAEVSYELLAKQRIVGGAIRLGIDFLSEKAEYTDMAAVMREKLVKAGLKEEYRESPLVLDVYNTVSKMGYTFGFPHKKSFCVTDFDQTAAILKDFSEAKIEMRLLGWDKEGALEGKIRTGYKPASSAGGKKGLNALYETAEKQGAKIYLNEEVSRFQKNAWGYTSFFNGAKGLSEKTVRLLPYLRSTLAQKTTAKPTYLLQVQKLVPTVEKILKKLPKEVDGIALSSLTKAPYVDYRQPYFDKESTVAEMEESVKKAADKKKIYADAPSWYALPYLSVAAELPSESSNYDLFDCSVPFLQLVLRGMMTTSSASLNLCGEPQINLLRSIETGTGLKFTFIGDYKELSSTSLNTLYGATYSMWRDDALSYFGEWKKALKGLETQDIVDHEMVAEGIAVTTYENGQKVVVNYTDRVYTYESVEVQPLNWARVEKGDAQS